MEAEDTGASNGNTSRNDGMPLEGSRGDNTLEHFGNLSRRVAPHSASSLATRFEAILRQPIARD